MRLFFVTQTIGPFMPYQLSASEWTKQFVEHIEQLLPMMPTAAAHAWAGKTYSDASDLSPAEAAQIFSEAIPPEEVGEPGD